MVAFLDVGFKSVSGPLIWDSYTIRGGCLAGLQSAQERVSKSLIIGLGWTHGVRLKQTVTCCFFQTESGSIFDCLAHSLDKSTQRDRLSFSTIARVYRQLGQYAAQVARGFSKVWRRSWTRCWSFSTASWISVIAGAGSWGDHGLIRLSAITSLTSLSINLRAF